MTLFQLAAAFAAAFIAGAINSVAGGGSMISFPSLMAIGLPSIIANATNTVGIWPGAIGSVWGFRREFAKVPKIYYWLLLPCLVGSIIGAFLLRFTSPQLFERIVPVLILFATAMFIVSPKLRERLNRKMAMRKNAGKTSDSGGDADMMDGRRQWIFACVLQTAVAIYGGYFGAGMGILMLSVLSILGMTDMLEMTSMTSFLSLAINGVAGIIFAFSGLIHWPVALTMMVGSTMGGYGAAGIARKVGGVWIRRFVIAMGFLISIILFVRLWLSGGTLG